MHAEFIDRPEDYLPRSDEAALDIDSLMASMRFPGNY